MIVYRITNLINGKLYFGITKCKLRKRWNEHRYNSKHKNSHIYLAMRKYGIENFIIEIVKNCDSEYEMYELEKRLIAKYKSNNRLYGYNNSTGGEISSKGKKLSKEVRKKISEYQKNRKRKPHTKEAKKNMSKAAKGRDMSKVIEASIKKTKGKPAHNRKKVVLNKNEFFDSITEASIKKGISVGSIHNNINGLSKKTKLGKWEYQ